MKFPNNTKLVDIGESAHTSNKSTYLGTDGLGPCVGIAVSATDNENIIHRFLAHAAFGYNLDTSIDELKQFILKIENIESVTAELISTQSFKCKDDLLPEERHMLNALRKIFRPYQKQNPGFKIRFRNSRNVYVCPDGNIMLISEKTKLLNQAQNSQAKESAVK